MKKLSLILFCLLISLNSLADDNVVEVKDIQGNIFQTDIHSLKNSNYMGKKIAGIWTKQINSPSNLKNKTKGKVVYSLMVFEWFNCADKTKSNVIDMIEYDKNGVILNSTSQNIVRFVNIVPNSISEYQFNTVCSLSMWGEYNKLNGDNLLNPIKVNEYDRLAKDYPYQIKMVEKFQNNTTK